MTARPMRLVIGFLPGASKNDAVSAAQGYIERHFEAIDISGWYIQKAGRDGYYYEVQEGGEGRAYLPSVLKLLDKHEELVITLTERSAKIQKGSHGEPETVLLPEGRDEPETEGLKAGPRLHPAVGDARGWLFAGGSMFIVGLLVLFMGSALHQGMQHLKETSVAARDLGPIGVMVETIAGDVVTPKLDWEPPKASALPTAQTDRLVAAAQNDKYVLALRYANGKWDVQTEDNPVSLHELLVPFLESIGTSLQGTPPLNPDIIRAEHWDRLREIVNQVQTQGGLSGQEREVLDVLASAMAGGGPVTLADVQAGYPEDDDLPPATVPADEAQGQPEEKN